MRASTSQMVSIFADALECDSSDALRAYLDRVCAGEPELRARIEALLAAHARSGEFLERPLTATEAALPERSEAEGTYIGAYKLRQQIGEGGFGVVYMAEQERPVRRLVALKVIKPGMDSREVISRFESERQTLAIMDHPNIAKVFDAGTTESGRPYFVMELVKGIPITEFCDECRMPTKERLVLFVSVCRAVQHAHHKGIIHRDIKPSNVLITLHDGAPVVKVIDFGVAKAITQKLTDRTLNTRFGQMIGTPAYMSPEQAAMSGLDIDTRSDVYSLGVLLYELLTGTTPLDKKLLREAAYEELQRLIREADTPRPSTRLTALGNSAAAMAGSRGMDLNRLTKLLAGELDWIVMKALEKDRNRRYGTPENLAEDVERYLRHEAILARPPSSAYKLRKFASRNRTAALAIAGISAALLIGLIGVTWALISQSKLRAEAEAQTRVAEQQAAIARAVTNIQRSMLTAVSPEQMRGDKVTVLEVMQSAVKELDAGELRGSPLVQASVRQAIGESLSDLGRFEEAEEQWRKALDVRLKLQGGDDNELAFCYFGLGNALQKQRKSKEAENSLRKALDIIRQMAKPDTNVSSATAAILVSLGDALDKQDRHSEAMQAYHDALDINAQAEHVDDEVISDCNGRIARFLHEEGQLAEAQAMFEEVLRLRRRLYPKGHPRIGDMATGLGLVLLDRSQLEEAEPLLEEALAISEKLRPPTHDEIGGCLNNLAGLRLEQERFVEAEELHRRAIEILEATLPKGDRRIGITYNNLGLALQGQGKHEEAEKAHRRALAFRREHLPSDHPDIALSLNNLAISLRSLNQLPDSVEHNREALAIYEQAFAPGHPNIANCKNNLATALATLGEFEEAEAHFQYALDAYLEIHGAEHWRVGDIRMRLGDLHTKLKRYPEAEQELIEAERVLASNKNEPGGYHQFCLEYLVRHYTERQAAEPGQGHDVKLQKWQETLQSMKAAQAVEADEPRAVSE